MFCFSVVFPLFFCQKKNQMDTCEGGYTGCPPKKRGKKNPALDDFFCASRTRFWFSRRTKCASRMSFFRFVFSTLVHTLNPLSIDTFLTTQSTTPCSCINYSKYSQLTYQQHITQTTHIPIIHDLLPKLLTHQLFACYFSCSMLSPGGAREEEGWYPENSESL